MREADPSWIKVCDLSASLCSRQTILCVTKEDKQGGKPHADRPFGSLMHSRNLDNLSLVRKSGVGRHAQVPICVDHPLEGVYALISVGAPSVGDG